MTAILSVTTAVAIALGLWLIWRRRSRLRRPAATTPLGDNVRFTVYRPSEIEPERWYSLLAFVHLSERPVDRPDEPDPVAVVKRQAAMLLQDEPAEYQSLVSDSLRAIPRAGELTLVPQMDGIEFNPAQQTFRWERSVHRADFQLRGLAGFVPRTARGRLTIYWGPLIVGDVPLAISVVAHAVSSGAPARADTVRAYRQIFASYSHRDVAVVEQFEEALAALGDRYLRDVRDLRAGQVWSDELQRMIEQADVFQLFWSWNALASPFVRQEWEFALGLRRENFLRPVYWEDPLPSRGDLPSEGLRRLHFHRLGVGNARDTPPPAEARPAPRFRWTVRLAAAAALLLVVSVLPLVMMQNESGPPPAGAPVGSAPPQTTIQPPAAMPSTRPPVDSLPAPVKPLLLARVRIPRSVRIDGKVLPAGIYDVSLVPRPADARGQSEPNEQWVELRKNGVVVAREIATVIPQEEINSASPQPKSRVELLKGGDVLRVSMRDKGKSYLLHLQTAK